MAEKRVSRPHSTTSFSRSGGNKLSNVNSFDMLRPGEGLASTYKDNSANFSGEKNYNEAFRGVYFCKVRKKPFQ